MLCEPYNPGLVSSPTPYQLVHDHTPPGGRETLPHQRKIVLAEPNLDYLSASAGHIFDFQTFSQCRCLELPLVEMPVSD